MYDMRKADVRPNRATWLIWGVVNWIIALSYDSAGAEWTSITVYAFAIGGSVLGLVSFFKGEGGLSRFDLCCILMATISIYLLVKAEPLPALFIGLGTNAIGTIPSARKLYLKTGQESILAYCAWVSCNTLNLIVALSTPASSLDVPKWIILFPPVFYVIQCTSMMYLILRARRTQP